MTPRGVILSIVASLCAATITAAAKSYVDVERLKVKVETLFDYVKETRDDVKTIKSHLINKRR
jgi:hypothetical protein